ncbi:efflux transporter outer membrane subunit [Pseudohalioglobus sediminis]|uniref:Efflux transporter outer membrane subunit n=1 Tax=Pseudohalioglobus sediminis TaxID=2606449 RepID=A0A5B0WPQ1_9GAMM|nr:efflux transporter outer membrane subunit [Pseudohalioglobus sediminis]KAA1188438.1 efflux transporter outer membrane subunit [Pseudohalioglobus sediminis]
MMPARRAATVALAAIILQACTNLGPDYEEPPVDWLQQWETDLYGQALTSAPQQAQDVGFWWQAFNDPILNQLIETARTENPTLRIAGLAILESRALLGIATGRRYPQVQRASGNWTRVDSWPTEGDDSGDHSQLNSYGAGFDVAWELDFWGRWRRGVESADAAFFASVTNQQNAQVLLAAQVADAYYAYRTTARQIEIARENAGLQKRSLEITTNLFESGQSAELDVQQARTQYLATMATIPELEIALRQIENALAVLLGRAPGELPEMAAVSPDLPTLNPVFIDDFPANLLLRRPDVRTAAWSVAAQSAQIGVARADLYPAISLFGTIGWSGNSLSGTNDTLSTGFGPAFSWNLFNYGRLENNVRVQDARLQQAIERYQLTVLAAASEIDGAAISVVKTMEQQGILADALAAAERSLTLSTKRYQEGYSDFQRVLTAQQSLAARSASYVSNQGAHISAVIDFYKAVGGGWQPANGDDLVPEPIRAIMAERTDWDGMLDAPLPVATQP